MKVLTSLALNMRNCADSTKQGLVAVAEEQEICIYQQQSFFEDESDSGASLRHSSDNNKQVTKVS